MQNAETVILANEPARRRKRKLARKRITWAILLILVLAGAAYWYRSRSAPDTVAPKDLPTAQSFRTTLIETVSATGSVTAQTGAQVKIGSQITGRIKRLYADVGQRVVAGQVIAELDSPDIEAQVQQSRASLASSISNAAAVGSNAAQGLSALSVAEEKLQQQRAGVGMQQTQTTEAVRTAQEALQQAISRRDSAVASFRQQPTQTRSDIRRAQAALKTAQANLNQVQRSRDLQIGNAGAAITEAEANARNAQSNYNRLSQLFKQGYVAASDVDTAQTQLDVANSQLYSARQNLTLAQAKADADLDVALQGVNQAQATVESARTGTFTDYIRQQDVRNAEAAVRQAQAALISARAGLTQNVLKAGDVAQAASQVEQARHAADQARSAALQARSGVEQSRQQVKYQEAQLAKTLIRSPISGTVLQMAAQQGETLAAGLSAPTLIVVADLDRLQVDAYVDETDIGKVKVNQSATVTVDAYPDRKFAGRVTKVASGSTVQQNVVTYDVAIQIHDPEHKLKPDMTASVTIGTSEHPNVVAVPSEAIKPGKSGGSIVWVFDKGMTAPEMRPVEVGVSDGTYTEVTSGLQEGETLVLAGWPPPEQFGGGMRMTPFGPRGGRRGG